jgi:hypothetical protein
MAQNNASRAGETQPSLTLHCSRQARRQHKRLCWLIVIVGLVLLANILATISGMGNPLYDAFHPAEMPASFTSTTTDSR